MRILLLLSILAIQSFAQPTFVTRTGSNSHGDFGTSCIPTSDGGTVLVQEATTNGLDIHSGLVKLDNTGNMQWNKLYQIGAYTLPFTVLQANDEGYIVLNMCTDSAFVNNNHHFIGLYKTDNYGNTLWNKQHTLSNNDLPLNLVRRKAGGYISFSVGDYNLGTYPKTIVTTYDDQGNIGWSKWFSAPYGLRGAKGIEMPNHNICFVGTVGDPAISFMLDMVVTMLDSSGNILWTKNFGSYYDDEPYAIASNASNEVFITGRVYFINRNWDSFLFRIDQNGNKIASRVYDGGTYDGEIMRCILAYNDGSCKLLGDMGTFDERDITLLNIDSSMAVTSACRYTFSPLFTNYPYDIYQATDGGLVFTGDYRPPTAHRDAIIAKVENDGSLPCFMTNPAFTVHNDAFHDTTFVLSHGVNATSQQAFPDNIPGNPFADHIVCGLAANTNEIETVIENIYPNPVNNILHVQFKTSNVEELKIVDVNGKVVYKEITDNKNTLEINLENLSSGVYAVVLRSLVGEEVKLIVKE